MSCRSGRVSCTHLRLRAHGTSFCPLELPNVYTRALCSLCSIANLTNTVSPHAAVTITFGTLTLYQ